MARSVGIAADIGFALAHIAPLYRVERDAKELTNPDGLESEQAWLA
jgi:hypothetical protein